MNFLKFPTLLILFITFCTVSADHIVFLHSCAGYSHRIAQWSLVDALIERGHSVTFISPHIGIAPSVNPNVTEIIPTRLQGFMKEVLATNFDVTNRANGFVLKMYMSMDYFCFTACDEALKSLEIQTWLSTNPTVDLVITDSALECGAGLAKFLDAKYALFLPIPFVTKYFEGFGVPPETSSIPDWDVSYKPPLSFFNRLAGAVLPLVYRVIEIFIFYPWFIALFKNELGVENLPTLYEMQANTSLIFINGDYLEDYPRSLPPFVVKLPGLHVRQGRKDTLKDKAIENFIRSRNNEGFIFISFGTIAKAPNLPLEIRDKFFKSIENFSTLKFIWRWDGPKPKEYPKNLLLVDWVNQQSLLRHPKIKGFVTQAGRPSTQEALYNGVPTITFPILTDQDFNAHRYEVLGCSINLDIVGITEEKLNQAITKIVWDKRYAERAIQLSKLAKDKPMGSLETAVWWVEFVLRHTQEEINLLKPLARNLTWYQRRDLDIWAFIFACIFIDIIVLYYLSRKIIFKLVFKKSNKNEKRKKK